jgi:hypothetical protein
VGEGGREEEKEGREERIGRRVRKRRRVRETDRWTMVEVQTNR